MRTVYPILTSPGYGIKSVAAFARDSDSAS